MTYEIATYHYRKIKLIVVYEICGGLRIDVMMTTDMKKAKEFIAAQGAVERVIRSTHRLGY